LYHWDTNAQAAYLSIDNANSANDKFISYDDEHTCQAKVSYARNRGLGGVMIWELASAWRPSQPAGKRDPMLQAVKQALAAQATISGAMELQSFVGSNCAVRLVASAVSGGVTNYLQTNDVTLNFTNGVAAYSQSVPTNTTHLSAKTAWHLRRRQAVTFSNGMATVNFIATNRLPAGDLAQGSPGVTNTDNLVASSDYLLMLGSYLQPVNGDANIARADANGDGAITSSDYLLLLGNYLTSGDAP
jgi:hypothetical protein